ncbi:hypothetical protein MAP00_000783 [Monascus purpureus]|nr:hypothetical protein MAP00_000783 [Monascus purpureus]
MPTNTGRERIQKTVELANKNRIKIIINGGALNPEGLAEKTHELEKKLNLQVAWVEADNLYPRVETILDDITAGKYAHLDAGNSEVKLERKEKRVVSANAYLGYRVIKRGLDEGADIIICGRVSDASPVIGAAAWWHSWSETDYDKLAGTLIAGHLVECSTYVTGANFAGFYKYDIRDLLNLGLPIAEVFANGETVITKHETLPGIVTADTVKCQLLYELQGNMYLNSDVRGREG